MKNKYLFGIINILLVLVIGMIFGLTCGDHIFSNIAGTSAFVCLLLTLFCPIGLYLFSKNMTLGGKICSGLFICGSLIVNIFFMIKPDTGIKAFWITQAILIGIFLISILIIIALFKDEKAETN